MERFAHTDNGIDLFGYPNPHLHSFCLALYLRAGAMFEKDDEQGITHFFEHAAFRDRQRAAGGAFFRRLDRLGLRFGGETSSELTRFYIVGAPAHFSDAARILAGLFEPFGLSKSEVDLERRRIKAELREDGELLSVEHLSRSAVWAGTPLQNPIVGRCTTLDRIGPKRLRAAQRALLAPENLFIYATGCVPDGGLEEFAAMLEAAELGPHEEKRENVAPVPERFGRRGADIRAKTRDVTSVRFAFDADCRAYSEPERMLLFSLLFDGENSRMYRALSDDTGYAYGLDACFERYQNVGSLQFHYEVRQTDLLKSVEAAVAALKKLKTGEGLDLADVKPAFTDDADMLLDDPEELNWTMAYERHFMGEPYESVGERRAAFEAVRAERLVELARSVFTPENLVLALGEQGKKAPQSALRALVEAI